MLYSACKLNKQGDNIQPCHTPFPILNQTVVLCLVFCVCVFGFNCCFLTHIQVSQETGKMFWYFLLSKSFPQFVMIHIVKGFSIVDEMEIDVFLKFPCFLYNLANVGNLISGNPAWTFGNSWFA